MATASTASAPQQQARDPSDDDASAPHPAVLKISDRVVRVLGLNPSAYTLAGTNTYLVGTGASRILIDAGDGRQPGYVPTLRRAMQAHGATSLQCIVVTHWHHDHLGGVPAVLEAFGSDVPVYKFMPREKVESQRAVSGKVLVRLKGSLWAPIHPSNPRVRVPARMLVHLLIDCFVFRQTSSGCAAACCPVRWREYLDAVLSLMTVPVPPMHTSLLLPLFALITTL